MSDAGTSPHVVLEYGAAQILDAHEHLIIRLTGEAPAGFKTALRSADWHRDSDSEWSRRNNPSTVTSAITLMRAFFGKPEGL